MTFNEQLFATLFGTMAGFCGSLILFWLKEALQAGKKKKTLIKNLDYEFDYNINLFKKYEKELTECLEKIAADDHIVYWPGEYSNVARFFSIQFYQQGLISKYLHPEDMKRWNDFLTTLSEGSAGHVLGMLDKWRKSEASKADVHSAVTFERKNITYAREMTEYLKGKIIK